MTTWFSTSMLIAQARLIWGMAKRAERAAFSVLLFLGVVTVGIAIGAARNVSTVLLCLLWAAVHFLAAWLVALTSIDHATQHEATAQYLSEAGGEHVIDLPGGASLVYTAEQGWHDRT